MRVLLLSGSASPYSDLFSWSVAMLSISEIVEEKRSGTGVCRVKRRRTASSDFCNSWRFVGLAERIYNFAVKNHVSLYSAA